MVEKSENSRFMCGVLNSYIVFNQEIAGPHANTLGEKGYVYVPTICTDGEACRLHISFHGCNQNNEAVAEQYATLTGLNRWADTNRLIVLYPQTRASMLMPLNPQGCWDWWGYTGSDYANREGKQIQAVVAMAKALANGKQKDKK